MAITFDRLMMLGPQLHFDLLGLKNTQKEEEEEEKQCTCLEFSPPTPYWIENH